MTAATFAIASEYKPHQWTPRARRLAVALVPLILITAVAFLGPGLCPFDPVKIVAEPLLKPSATHWFGTDEVGRDIFSRSIYGFRTTWTATLAVIASSTAIGGLVGLVAGVLGGWVDAVLMRLTDIFLAIPGSILAIAVVASLGPSLFNTVIAIIAVWWPPYARLVRAETRAFAVRANVEAARLGGISEARVAFRHLLPGAAPVAVIAASLDVGSVILTLASLSFLGLGSPAPAPELGAMVDRGLPALLSSWWVPIWPAVVVLLLAFISNIVGDAVRATMEDQ